MDIVTRLGNRRKRAWLTIVVGIVLFIVHSMPVVAQLAEFGKEQDEEPRRFIGIIGGQVTKITNEQPEGNLCLVFNGYVALSPGATTAGGIAVLTGGLGRRDLIHVGVSATHYFSKELGRGLFVQANAGVAQLYENIITFNTAPSVGFGSYISAGYSLEIARSLPALHVGVVQGIFTFGDGYYPIGIQVGAVF